MGAIAAIAALARFSNGGVIVTASRLANVHELIITLAARHRLPAVYSLRFFVASGGLASYGPDVIDPYRRADVPPTLLARADEVIE
jgi:putative ABC transport system substrate-binding protein